MSTQSLLADLLTLAPLPRDRARAFFDAILTGEVNEIQVGAALALIAARGPSIDELAAGVQAMRACAVPVHRPASLPPESAGGPVLIDTCGTGGAPKTFNISTAAAIVAAAAAPGRILVAKHGGRSRSGRGSAEVLAALGVNIDATPAQQTRCLERAGVCFSFAVNHHPAMTHAAAPRKSLGFPTIFNLLGPMCNPAGATRQLVGTWNTRNAELIARTLATLGTTRALVVTSDDGFDELTTTAPNRAWLVEGPSVTPYPIAHALPPARAADFTAATVDDAARIIRDVLGNKPGPAADIVLLNAAAALVVAGVASDLAAGLELAQTAITSGRAAITLNALRSASASEMTSPAAPSPH
jgi:anthranilate phosphoribosyltransferase